MPRACRNDMTGRPAPVEGLHVLDLSDRIAGAYCTKLLVDAGAEVIKLETAVGDPLRQEGALFSYLYAGTESVVADPDDRDTLAGLVRWSDAVVLTCGRRDAMATGRDPGALAAVHPRSDRRLSNELRMDGTLGGASGDRVHTAGALRSNRIPWFSRRSAGLGRRPHR